ncbi:DUF1345 domain-containing protein [Taibaiella chishuiensis]|uniref:Putative membrane protein n=1 Tax=Taibaiella chishuiensis TaxID=1434707 RepID=A0A2P8D5T4_9BACT|nr:DUF1345 domain-containing protein [Taibaiella chishuiensis]PSK92584.1 putative membrane protein [Taibaiella chishuiensis]
MSKKAPVSHRLSGAKKLAISALAGIITYLAASGAGTQQALCILLGWDIFCLCFLLLSWVGFFKPLSHSVMRREAQLQHEKGITVFVLSLLATMAGFLTVFLLLLGRKEHSQLSFLLVTAFLGLLLSWTLVHTLFTTRYAYMFYADHRQHPEVHAGGLEFPEEPQPGFLDFAYFSFVIGMTFQVSDVAVSSSRLRKTVLLHGLISFGFNTIIVALTINLIAGLS